MQQQLGQSTQLPAIKLNSLISYPTKAQVGKKYLLTIDVQTDETDVAWPYPEEEYEISLQLNLRPFFSYQSLVGHTPAIILHRFGGTYGPAEFILTANTEEVPTGTIKITFRNAAGLTIAYFELPCEIRQEVEVTSEQKRVARVTPSTENRPISPASLTTVIPPYIEEVEQQLQQAGWTIIEYETFKSRAWGRNTQSDPDPLFISFVAVKSLPLYPHDYVLLINEEIVGFVKTQHPNEPLNNGAKTVPSSSLAETLGEECKYALVPFVYDATGSKIQSTNKLEINPQCREIAMFHRPETLQRWIDGVPDMFALSNSLFRSRIQNLPSLKKGTLRPYQFEALQALEQSLARQHTRTLVQMDAGSGQTHTLISSIYRLLKYGNAKHILYIVDSPSAAGYAMSAFEQSVVEQDDQNDEPDSTITFTDSFNVHYVQSFNHRTNLNPDAHVYVAMLEDIYPLLTDHLNATPSYDWNENDGPLPVAYNNNLPIEYFDAIFLAESEYVQYNRWKLLLSYFDATIIGMADHVSEETLEFFQHNLVYPRQTKEEVRQHLSRTIKSIRNLLRRDAGLAGDTDRLSQLTWLLFLKNLDDFEMTQEEMYGQNYKPILEAPYRWRDWAACENLSDRRTGDELLTFVNADLTHYLKSLSGENNRDIRTIVSTIFQGTSNCLKSGYVLCDVIDNLNTINFNSFDIVEAMSIFYETMLREMRDSAGDSGEFYTPRPVVHFIVDRLNPRLGELIMDPACGTAGFLIEAYTRMSKQVRTAEQQQLLLDSLIGIEKKSTPYLLAIMNMLLHGIESPNVIERNALSVNVNQIPDDERVDIVATNPPFGGEEEEGILNNFPAGMRTHETPLLFVQYIMALLKRPGGRAGIVMPNGFLFRNGIANRVKEQLLTQFNLHTIIRLPHGVFAPYTSIPTNMLFFDAGDDFYLARTRTTTQEVWYYEISPPEGRKIYTKTRPIQDEDFQACSKWWDERVENAHAWKISIDEIIKNNYNLDFKNPYPRSEV
ncbi:N-6 DNA methylase [Dictyobacter arantiisoli]|uniref:site-specific DNA-methyltransferase (adenine-specific) n=1 Tax=Dictyobacter arantiisoli TaxID=2014874 RepID=A0A5A5TFC1_9CHLR|nr:N-6 DNA methylase [Dictyobacter arantiisoli]GCF09604.1 hypothetical protein KDI_31680 [Dictyobacter arantiisoli]